MVSVRYQVPGADEVLQAQDGSVEILRPTGAAAIGGEDEGPHPCLEKVRGCLQHAAPQVQPRQEHLLRVLVPVVLEQEFSHGLGVAGIANFLVYVVHVLRNLRRDGLFRRSQQLIPAHQTDDVAAGGVHVAGGDDAVEQLFV